MVSVEDRGFGDLGHRSAEYSPCLSFPTTMYSRTIIRPAPALRLTLDISSLALLSSGLTSEFFQVHLELVQLLDQPILLPFSRMTAR